MSKRMFMNIVEDPKSKTLALPSFHPDRPQTNQDYVRRIIDKSPTANRAEMMFKRH